MKILLLIARENQIRSGFPLAIFVGLVPHPLVTYGCDDFDL
jgi:hypothetical protein